MKICVIISGDPRRKELCERFASYYRKIPGIEKVLLLYEKNPAKAFNKGATQTDCDTLFCVGGDVLVKPSDVLRMAKEVGDNEVLFAVSLRRRTKLQRYLFQSGAFAVKRKTIIKYPMPEEPDFLEEVYWMENRNLVFKPFFTNFYHIHKHSFSHIFETSIRRWGARVKLRKRSMLIFVVGSFKLFLESIKIYLKERTQFR
jgi:hypothetical protein